MDIVKSMGKRDIDSETNEQDEVKTPENEEEESSGDEEEEESSEEKDDEKESEDEDDEEKSEDEEEKSEDEEGEEDGDDSYRPKSDKSKQPETVPFNVFLKQKQKVKELKEALAGKTSSKTITEDVDKLAKKFGVEPTALQGFADTIIAATEEKQLLRERAEANERAFEEDFNKTIVKNYPELANKKNSFKKIAFSKDFLHLKDLSEIRKEFFPDAKSVKTKKESSEGAGVKTPKTDSEKIDFANLSEAQHAKVLADPKLRAKYYEWQDTQDH